MRGRRGATRARSAAVCAEALFVAVHLVAAPAGAQGPSCFDRVQSGPESDVDCGGDCPGCSRGQRCSRARDCASGVCASGTCIENAYRAGEPIPNGYRVEVSESDAAATVRRFGLWLFGISYAAAYVGALSYPTELAWLYAPVIGPWAALGPIKSSDLEKVVIAGGVLQAGGAALLIGGIAGRGHQLVRSESARLELVPRLQVAPRTKVSSWGLSVAGSF